MLCQRGVKTLHILLLCCFPSTPEIYILVAPHLGRRGKAFHIFKQLDYFFSTWKILSNDFLFLDVILPRSIVWLQNQRDSTVDRNRTRRDDPHEFRLGRLKHE